MKTFFLELFFGKKCPRLHVILKANELNIQLEECKTFFQNFFWEKNIQGCILDFSQKELAEKVHKLRRQIV